MLKKVMTTGLAIGVAFGAAGTGAFAFDGGETNVDLSSKLNAELNDGSLMSSQNFELAAEQNGWNGEDLQVWAESQGMTEVELQDWARQSGWSEEDSSRLDLNLNANIQLDDLLNDSSEGDYQDNHNEEDDNLLDDLLGDLL